MSLDDLRHAQRERLVFLDQCLTWRGMANRRDLTERFGISTAQAALDFRAYLGRMAETPPVYDPVRKAYLAAPGHVPLCPSSLSQAFGILGDADTAPAALPRPERPADPAVIARLYQAVRTGMAVNLCYISMSSGHETAQWIAPVRFTSDGETVLLRAFSYLRGEYRSYHPIRIDPDSSFDLRPIGMTLPEDRDWQTRAIIWLRPRTGLSPRQQAMVRREYGFDGDSLRIETRKALEFHIDRRWGLNTDAARLERVRTEYVAPGEEERSA